MFLNNLSLSTYSKRIIKIIFLDFLLVAGIILVILGGYVYYQNQYHSDRTTDEYSNISYNYENVTLDYTGIESSPDASHNMIEVEIPEGVSSLEIALILEEKNLISAENFLKLVDMFALEKEIKAGTYTFSGEVSFIDIIDTIM